MVATAVDYTNHFWGQKHHGYHVLYENLKHEEESVQELAQFVKERATYEEEWNKFLNKCIAKTNGLVAPSSMFSNAWLVTKNTMELLTEIQASFYITLQHLLKDVFKYHDDLVRSRKKMKEQDVVDAVNLMQTTTTCLQKSKETYAQRVNELERLKKENATPKDISKAENKLNKSHDEYKGYVDKYGRVRADFEEKMIKATRLFQAHDQAFLIQMKAFMAVFARALDESASATSQVCALYRDSVDNLDIDGMLIKFVETKGTGKDRPEFAVFEEIDTAKDINVPNFILAPCSDLTTAAQRSVPVDGNSPATPHLVTLDTNTFDSWNSEISALKVQPSPVASDSSSSTAANIGPGSLPFSASLGRQKLSLWLPGKRKKYASQSSLPVTEPPHQEFSHSQSESLGFLKKYRSKHKKSNTDITASNIDGPANEDSKSTASSSKSEEKPFVTTNGSLNILDAPVTVPSLGDNDDEVSGDNFSRSRWSSCTDSSDDDENLRQAAKLRHISIKPLSESKANITASVDELRDAIGNIVLHPTTFSRSSTFDCANVFVSFIQDPWSSTRRSTLFSTGLEGNVRPLRAALTGDDHIRRKHLDSYNSSLPFSISMSGSNIVRARPHSSTPTPGASNLTLQTCDHSLMQHSTRVDSVGNKQTFSRSESALSLEQSTTIETPFTTSASNLLSASATITENRIPVAMAINEYIHAWFRGTDPAKTTVRVFGSVLVSFPATVVPALTDLTSDIDPLIVTLKNADKIKTISPNSQLISQVIDAFAAPYTFTFEKTQLAEWLSARKVEKPDSQFFNTEVLTYEVKEPTIPPLVLIVYWKLEAQNTDLRIDYRLNMDSSIDCSLMNVVFTTKVEGSVISVIADPNAEWSPSNNTLSWKLAELSRNGESSGSLKARLSLSSGPATASQTFVQFQTSNVNISGVDVTITSDDLYHLSMVRRNVFSGKYFCDAEIRS
uniref:MHD domain-containing protein n=1 Tax=Elaeophora elaphi TaxID=1147741 RepID=A0A0R3RTY1_9BILA